MDILDLLQKYAKAQHLTILAHALKADGSITAVFHNGQKINFTLKQLKELLDVPAKETVKSRKKGETQE